MAARRPAWQRGGAAAWQRGGLAARSGLHGRLSAAAGSAAAWQRAAACLAARRPGSAAAWQRGGLAARWPGSAAG
jgi:hypothetical protein